MSVLVNKERKLGNIIELCSHWFGMSVHKAQTEALKLAKPSSKPTFKNQKGSSKNLIFAMTLFILVTPASASEVKLDTSIPVITLIGADTVTIHVGENYVEAGAKASDDLDGDISAIISSVSTLDNSKPGSYAVAYNVTDAAGNVAVSVYRFIHVVKTAAKTVNPALTASRRVLLTRSDKTTFAWAVNLVSMTTQSSAQKIIEQLKTEKVETELVMVNVKGRTYYRIRIPSLTSKQEANEVMAAFKDRQGYSRAWTSRYPASDSHEEGVSVK